MLREELPEHDRLDATDVTRMVIVDLVLKLASRDADLLSMDDDDVIPHIDVRAIARLMLALQTMGNL